MLSNNRCVGLFLLKAKVRSLPTPHLIPEEDCRTGSSDSTRTLRIIKPEDISAPQNGSRELVTVSFCPSLTHPLASHWTTLGSALVGIPEVLVQV